MDNRFFNSEKTQKPVQVSYASHPDRAQDFPDQARWDLLSIKTQSEFLKLLPSFSTMTSDDLKSEMEMTQAPDEIADTEVGRAFIFLAARRMEIAETLKHAAHEKRTNHYGLFRDKTYGCKEVISYKDVKLQNQTPTILSTLHNIVKEGLLELPNDATYYENENFEFISTDQSKPNVDGRPPCGAYAIEIKNPFSASLSSDKLNSMVVKIGENAKEDTAILYYSNPDILVQHFKVADVIYKNARAANTLDELLLHCGELAYYLEVILPVRLGTSSIIEWMVRNLAREKEYELGPFNLRNSADLGWDFRALTSTSIHTYSKWFQSNAFAQITEIDDENEKERVIKKQKF